MIIDDVLSDGFVDQESEATSDFIHCQKFINNLIRDRLRVTWTTGELDDLTKLREPELSAIQYIFLDLHLTGISENNSYKDINAKILGIFANVDEFLEHDKITCYLNSKYRSSRSYAEEGKKDLEEKLRKKFDAKYHVKIVEDKNHLSKKQKNELIGYSLKLHARNWIIIKSIHVESVLDSKLKLVESEKINKSFYDKSRDFASRFLIKSGRNKDLSRQIELLRKMRNALAHTENTSNYIDIEDKDGKLRNIFWCITTDRSTQDKIRFTDFDHLVSYISSIDILCDSLKQVNNS